MRIATTTLFNIGSSNLQGHIADQAKLQSQLSSGRKILTPADDPIASARILDIAQAKSINEQYATNSSAADSFMRLSESTMHQVTGLIQNVQELAVSAGNPALGPEEKRMKEAELKGRYQELLALANTTDGQGNYLFSGFKGDTKPFTESSFGNVGYFGDDGQRIVQISDGRQIPISESGADVFQRIKNGNGTFVTAYNSANVGSGIVSPGEVTDPQKWAAAPAPRDFSVQFYWQPNATKPEAPIITYDLIDSSGVSLISGAATAGNTSGPRTFSSGGDIEFKRLPSDPAGAAWDYGIKMNVSGSPIPLDPTTKIPTGAPGAADNFSVKPSTNVDLFTTLGKLSTALNSYQIDGSGKGQASFQNQLNTALSDLSNALSNVVTTQAYLGARMNETDSVKDTTEDLKLQYAKTLSGLQDLDYAAAISDFAQNQMVLDAARKSFAQVQDLSLFKYI
ncbi:flagellar hook-associated protein FlgL [Chitinibacter fontanus]|uniref:Flagellar hook-associated protein FlgL n=1 Tax=Chitinibacter fontanus TaxID=1737446 RepID=A0A7D5Z5M6_9NEIS|nr:flagellar hook-associated protein FlgL [Chitinibacter fontanus]QLI82461.1 flagellar hook-associated protein FlgL [Chitinibacter fontanus]